MKTTSTATEITCYNCNKPIKPLGLVSVACDCKSFSIGIDDINATGDNGMVYGSWPVTMADVMAIHKTRCVDCDHAGIRLVVR